MAFATTVSLPAEWEVKASAERAVFFESVEQRFGFIERLHRILLVLSPITLIGAVLGSHGALFIG